MFNRIRVAGLAALILVLGLTGCGRQALTDQQHVQRAKDFQDKGDLRASAIELKNALQKNPKNSEARLLLGEIYIEGGLGDAAEKELLRAKELGVAGETLALDLSRAYLLQQKYDQTLKEAQPGANTAPANRAKFLQLRGDALLGLNRSNEGCPLYQDAIALDAKLAAAYWGLAHCAAVRGDIGQARAELDRAVQAEPKNVLGWTLIGDLERLRQNGMQAEAAYTQALKINPHSGTALMGRAMIYIDQNKLDAAAKDIETFHQHAPEDFRVSYLQALVSFRKGQYPAALDAIQQSLKLEPNFAASALVIGLIQHKLGQLEQAETNLSRYLAVNPSNLVARKELAAVLLSRNETQRAMDLLTPALRVFPDDPQFLALMGSAHMKRKEYVKATEYYAKATVANQKSSDLRTDLGMSRMVVGDTRQAMADLTAASLMDPAQYRADIMLVIAYLGKQDYAKAQEVVDALEKKQPNNPITYNLRGSVLLGQKNPAAARAAYEKSLVLDPTYFPSAMNLATMDLNERKPDQAKKRYLGILAKDRVNLQAMLALAQLAAEEKNEKEYVSWLDKAMRTNPNALQPILLLARYYLQTNKPQQALSLAREAQSASPDSVTALELLGAVQLAVGEGDNAVASFSQVVSLAPNAPEARLQMAGAQMRLGRTKEARVSLQKALELKPDYLDALVALISLELGDRHGADALQAARRLQQAYPKLAAGFAFEGDAQMQDKQAAAAAKAYALAFSMSPNGDLVAKLHQALSQAGNRKEADEKLKQWLAAHPEDPSARLYSADVYLSEGNRQAAIEQIGAVLSKNPNNLAALNSMALAHMASGGGAGAIDYAQRAYRVAPNNPAVLTTLARVYLQLNQAAKAVPLLESAIRKAPEVPDIHYYYALALIQSGDKVRGKNELQSLLNSGRSFAQREEAKKLLNQ